MSNSISRESVTKKKSDSPRRETKLKDSDTKIYFSESPDQQNKFLAKSTTEKLGYPLRGLANWQIVETNWQMVERK